MKDLKITKGKYSLYKGKKNLFISTPEWLQFIKIYVPKSSKIEAESNASLILDTFETANKCNLLPSELLDQRDELFRLLEKMINYLNGMDSSNRVVLRISLELSEKIDETIQSIKKAQQ